MAQLTDVRDAMLAVLPDKTYHFEAPDNTKGDYLIWAEDGQGESRCADNEMVHQTIQGTTDLYTDDEYNPLFSRVQNAFRAWHIPFRLNSIQHEPETGKIHYEWIWEVGNA